MASITAQSLQAAAVSLGGRTVSSSASCSLFVQFPGFASLPKSGRRIWRVTAQTQADKEIVEETSQERFRLNNLAPQPGSRRRNLRKGRGIAAGQGASCGFGMRGQNSRSGPNVRQGFEGGQTPLYRRLPKLKGIAGGMGAGLPKFVSVNLADIMASGLPEGAEVSLESLKEVGLINPTGRMRKLPLKILGKGTVEVQLSFKAASFSTTAREKLEAGGCSMVVLPGRKKFLPANVVKRMARTADYNASKRGTSEGTSEGSSEGTSD